MGNLWAGLGAGGCGRGCGWGFGRDAGGAVGGVGRGPARCCPISPQTEFLVQEQSKGSSPEGPAQLEGALTLGLPVWKAGSTC